MMSAIELVLILVVVPLLLAVGLTLVDRARGQHEDANG